MSEFDDAMAVLNKEIKSKDNLLVDDEYKNKIINDDCLSVLSRMPDGSVDLCVTDPPWGVDMWTFREKFKHEDKIENDEIRDYINLMDEFPSRLYRVMKNNTSTYVFCGSSKPIIPKFKHGTIHWSPWDMAQKFWEAGFRPRKMIMWDKVTPGMYYRYRAKIEFILYLTKGNQPFWAGEGEFKDDYIQVDENEVVRYPKVHGSRRVHIAEKPVRLYEAFIMDSSDLNDLVIDPFAGSGPVVEAAKNTGRNYLAIEKDPANIPKIEKREKQISLFEILAEKHKEKQTEMPDA